MEWSSTIGDTTYATAAWPLVLAALAAVCALVLAVWQHGALRGAGPSVPRPALGTPAALCLAFLFCAPMLHGAFALFQAVRFWSASRVAWSIFGALFALGLFCAFTAGVTAVVILARHARHQPSPATAAIPALALSLFALGWTGLAHATLLVALGPFPGIAVERAPWVHRGQPCTLTPALEWYSDHPEGAETAYRVSPQQSVDTSALGAQTLDISAHRFALSMRNHVTVLVREELGDPAFPLGVGNRWRYAYTRSRRDSLWVNPSETTDTLVLEIAGAEVDVGVRRFELRGTRGDKSSSVWLYAVDGRVYVTEPGGHPERYGATPVPLELGAVGGAAKFASPLLGGNCAGVAAIGPSVEIPGPCDCVVSDDFGIATGLSAALSLGLLAPGIRSEYAELLDSRRGSDDAPHVALAKTSAPPPRVPDAQACENYLVCVLFDVAAREKARDVMWRFPLHARPLVVGDRLRTSLRTKELAHEIDLTVSAVPVYQGVCSNRLLACRFTLASDKPPAKLAALGVARVHIDQAVCGYPEPP
jgi:hypothetical protein